MSKVRLVVCAIAVALVSVLVVPADLFGQGASPLAGRSVGEAKNSSGWGEAECVFTAKLEGVDAGPVANSMPPIYHHTLHLTVQKCLRGALKAGEIRSLPTTWPGRSRGPLFRSANCA